MFSHFLRANNFTYAENITFTKGSIMDTNEQQRPSASAMLEASNLTKRYDDGTLALDHISFEVFPGQIYAMLGANGAGKTTTINLFLNFIEPTEGEAKIDGIVTHKEPLRAKEKVSYVSENVMLYTNFTALQNLDFFARLGGKTQYSKNDYRDVLLRVGLQEEAHGKRLKGFSKGMRQKNLVLSQRRAESVRNYLIKRGVAADHLRAVGFGPDRPVGDNRTNSGRESNRRVEFVINQRAER